MFQRYRHLITALGMLVSALILVEGATKFFEYRAQQDISKFEAPRGL